MNRFIQQNRITSHSINSRFHTTTMSKEQNSFSKLLNKEYSRAIEDLNSLQTNKQTVALAKYRIPEQILPLFRKQLSLAGIEVEDLDRLNIIHVSGTKGKGSTCAFVESILKEAGEKTGFYNSPHLIKVNERIRINGKPIDDAMFMKYFRYIYDRLSRECPRNNVSMPTYFSFLTILAFHIFLEEKIDCAVIEVGIGGNYDPTNIVQQPIACGISTLDYDHTNILGTTLESIARAKAGIIKKNVPIYTVPQVHEGAIRIIESRAEELGSPMILCKPLDGVFSLGIKGSAQLLNGSLAVHLAKEYMRKVRGSELGFVFLEGLRKCSWPGRCQIIHYPKLTFFLDGAHTGLSMSNCLDWYLDACANNDPESHKILMINVIGEREKSDVMRPLVKFNGFDKVLFSTNRITDSSEISSHTFSKTSNRSLENARLNAETWNELLTGSVNNNSPPRDGMLIMETTQKSISHLIELSKLNPDKRYHVLATGSLHFVGAILETLQEMDQQLSS